MFAPTAIFAAFLRALSMNHAAFALGFLILAATAPRAAAVEWGDTEIIYDNSLTYRGSGFANAGEFGDEVFIKGKGPRRVVEFAFEYFGDFVPSGDEMGRVRFYKNDGLFWPPASYMPGTVIFDSGWFAVTTNGAAQVFKNMDVLVDTNFTWSVEFAGVTGEPGDRVSLLIYDPPNVGRSFKDIWVHAGSAWNLVIDRDRRRLSFGARVIAEVEAPAIVGLTFGNDAINLTAKTRPWRRYQLQSIANAGGTNWVNVGDSVVPTGERFVFNDAMTTPSKFYRVLEIAGEEELPFPAITNTTIVRGQPTFDASVLFGYTYQLEWRDSSTNSTNGVIEWVPIGQPLTSISNSLRLVDPRNPAPEAGEYRVVYVHQIETFAPPEFTSERAANGNVKLTGTGVAGQHYQWEYTSTPALGNWKPLGSPTLSVDGKLELVDPLKLSDALRSYRLVHVHTPTIRTLHNDGQRALIIASAVKGRKYALEYKDSLTAQNWSRTSLISTALGPTVVLRDNGLNRKARFYRVIALNN